jgi:hypothetical protein
MKTQIVQLEAHDDYISVRDRMGWGQTTRVLLVWPLRGRILNRRLDLILLKRHSDALGSQLALVTRDRDVRYHADRLNIPVYKSIRAAEESRWRPPRRRRKRARASTPIIPKSSDREKPDLAALQEQAHPPSPRWLRHPIVRISFFTLGVLSMLVIAALFIPSAEIHITPATIRESVTIDVNASPDHKAVDISGAVPTYWDTVIVEGRGTTAASGETSIPRQSATGRVTFVNLTDDEITVPLGTIVSTGNAPPIRFSTTRELTIPTGTEGSTVPIQALQPGSASNISAGEIVAIEGGLGLNLTATNERSISGGSDFTATAPDDVDYVRVYDHLVTSLQDTAFTEFQFGLQPYDVVLSASPILQQTLEETYTPEIGQPSDYLDLTLRLEFLLPYARGTDLYQLGRTVLERHLTADFSPRPDTLQIIQLSEPETLGEGEASWKMSASWQMGANIDAAQAVALALGLTPEQATQQLIDQMPIDDNAKVHLTPEWWPRLPVLPFRITVINELEMAVPQIGAAH